MRTDFDFGPLFRSTVGFDRMFDLLRGAAQIGHLENYPPCDIERIGEDGYRVTLAVAGFSREELAVTAQQNLLVVSGEKRVEGSNSPAQPNLLYRGIAARSFERRFELADHVHVLGADLSNGLLSIELRRELPEAMRPRRIRIGCSQEPRYQIEGQASGDRHAA
ncbi:Hsp20 family protein [Roseomonas marmotae]|uniref:Hsp20 family protein n=1 Tax=Roseomonas marmotae TaxID=2768161 RepID=A0ABS3KCK5_9PROT|nr:Hsp20 family protein [Roseomonas marmotae]MBO1075202.1 Hsp20 family protein [Roseomonas marmotae]QTI79691.1 Hsp20 family protein [Roseomonas marmotae]